MLFSSSWLLRAARRSGGRTWNLPDIRQQGQTPIFNRLQGAVSLYQHSLPDVAAHRSRGGYGADAQAALLSRPKGRASRVSSQRATFHYERKHARQRFNGAQFRKYYNDS